MNYIQSLLEGKGTDQKVESLRDDFSQYQPIPNIHGRSFVKQIQTILWPTCRWFKKLSTDIISDIKLEDDQYIVVKEEETSKSASEPDSSNSNLPDVFALIETDYGYYFLASYRSATLQDLITYNPGVLSSNLKMSIIIYQLLRVIASLHSRGVLHGNLKASNILVDENLWIQLAGIEFEPNPIDFDIKKWLYEQEMSKRIKEIPDEPLVVKWIKGKISNFSYLMALNYLAGRREGDPNFYPILPWVTDFSGQTIEDGWRDFKKTKFRINKGDEQLDFTFDGPVPHHITDILSDITYYVYKARRTPIPVLCQFVRSKYEPNEYPSSMQRLYQWTPDECIPDFYTDSSIFKSIHSDMPDIQMPEWASSPEDFIRKHSEALESDHVSANLHHWIDLTFGRNLTGKGAIEAKNVALPLLAGQNSFMKHGIIQLFKDKHPERGCNWNKLKKKIQNDTMLSASSSIMNSERLYNELKTEQYSDCVNTKIVSSSISAPTIIENLATNAVETVSPLYVINSNNNNNNNNSSSSSSRLYKNNSVSSSVRSRHTVLSNNNNHTDGITNTAGLVSHIPSTFTSAATTSTGNASVTTNRDRASSIHSTISSIDTSRSLPSSFIITATATTTTTVEPLISALRTEPIHMPISIEDNYFVDNLEHYENMMTFATKYKFIDRVSNAANIWINPCYPNPPQRFEIDPVMSTDKMNVLDTNKLFFAVGAAYDMYCLGKIIEQVYTAGNSKMVDSDGEPSEAPASGYFQVGNGDVSYDIAPTSKVDIIPAVKNVITSLTCEKWQDRPTAKAILCSSSFLLSNPFLHCCYLPFPNTVSEIYEYLTTFHQAEWLRKLYLADKWIDRICDLDNEAFILLLPSFSQLFIHPETRIGSISLFPKLAQRLGPEKTRRYLLKRIISIFESLRPHIPKILFSEKIIYEFIKRLGISVFLQQLLPCYLEALAVQENTTINVATNNAYLSTTTTANNSIKTSEGLSSITSIAGDAMVYICILLGPILTSKHIIRQLIKIILRDNQIRPSLIHTTLRIMSAFGATFTEVQHAYLISLIDTFYYKSSSKLTTKNAQSIYALLTLLQELIPYMSNEALMTEFKSGFGTTLYQLLEPVIQQEKSNIDESMSDTKYSSSLLSDDQLKLCLSVSAKTIDYLLKVSEKLTFPEWELTILSILQKYFSAFSITSLTADNGIDNQAISKVLARQKNYQIMYSYYKFCTIVSREKMRQVIPTR
ncbi:uncharacterized protein BX663DRAFT_248978 [Cokeromyces recurvatus]|uniref:uncharacterized protein n=1 Tax=Cokeromyces recurvatus TaxID=90255 RepID=UPI00221E5058|nr:uncharacterized protein BX663DRAFT_248978 [Cokeromyces recurvatus]KAI7906033.1 hypothetical protein BX663DRAFT_248978 [Cokeromyces recurvatus]